MGVPAAVAAQLAQSIIGEKQLGAAAPAFSPGQSNFDALQLGDQQDFSGMLQAILSQSPVNPLEQLIGKPEERGQELAPQVRANEQVTELPSVFNTQAQNTTAAPEGTEGFVGPSATPADEQGVFSKFFGNLDQNLQSPSKLLGLSLLSQIDPRLAQGGLVAGGLFGQNKF